MKINKILLLGLASVALLLSSCTKDQLNAEPSGSTMTEDQLKEALAKNPSLVNASIDGMYGQFIAYGGDHNYFGFASFIMCSDLFGQDMVMNDAGYNRFWFEYEYTMRTYEGATVDYLWQVFYGIIDKANEVIRSIDEQTAAQSPELRYALSQARAVRAYIYFTMAQTYAFTNNYTTNRSQPCVPIVTEKTTSAEAGNNPPATVGEIYDQIILPDLQYALTGLEGFNRGSAKHKINKQVVQGMLARVYLVTQNWTEAAKMANAARTGYTPMSGEEYNNPQTGFNDLGNSAWMWGSDVTPSSQVAITYTGSFTSHISSLAYGYAVAGDMQKCISIDLYKQMGAADIRKNAFHGWNDAEEDGWWSEGGGAFWNPPYANIKFKPYQGVLLSSVAASDIVMMRAEEMYLIEAEALARGGNGGNPTSGRDLMVDMIKTYRDANYTCAATTEEEVVDAIWLQRRLEFWGEGLAWFDLKRLGKPLARNYAGENNFQPAVRFNLPASSTKFLLPIPRAEILNNSGIPADINNDGRLGQPTI